MNNIINLEEHRKRRNKPQFIDMDKVIFESEIALEKHIEALERLNKYCEAAIVTGKEWKR